MDTCTAQSNGTLPSIQDAAEAAVHIVSGVHAGASIPVSTLDALLIGASEDCDIILTDAGIKAHHCMLSARSSTITLRPIDDLVVVNGRPHPPGENALVAVGDSVRIGGALLEIVSAAEVANASTPRWRRARRRLVRATLRRHGRLGIAAVAVMALACALRPVRIANGIGVAPALQASALADNARPVTDRTGGAIAQDVEEVLRLSGIAGEVHDESNGAVTVRGHLGDPQTVARIVQSRAMREITGLKRVTVLNLDQPQVPNSGAGDGAWVVRAIPGKDPYVIAADGSRYYLGAELPRGGRLAGVQDGEILVDRDGRVEHLRLSEPGLGG